MKKFKVRYLLITVLLLTGAVVFAQTDSGFIYLVDDIAIDYSSGMMKIISAKTGNIVLVPNTQTIENISEVKFISDSVLSVSNEAKRDVLLNINKIEQITVNNGVSGSYIMGGVGMGALFGLGVGLLIYGLKKEDEKPASYGPDPFGGLNDLNKFTYAGPGLLIGAVVGGIMGALIPDYESYGINKYKNDKKQQVEKIIRKAQK